MADSSQFDLPEEPFFGLLEPEADAGEAPAPPRPARRSGKYATRLLADYSIAARPRRHAKAPRAVSAGLSVRGRALAAAGMVGAVAAAGAIFLVLPSHPKATSMAGCGPAGCPAPSTVTPETSFVAGAPGAMEMSASQAASAPAGSPTATVNPTVTAVTSAPSTLPTSGNPLLAPGSVISVEGTTSCCQSLFLTHDQNDHGVMFTQVTLNSSQSTRLDAIWLVQSGLADSACISFESVNAPGEYLRHQHFALYLDPDDGSAQFAYDATFCPRPGNSGQGESFASFNDPQLFIRHFDNGVYIASDGGANPWDTPTWWHRDTSWDVIQYLS